MCAFPPPNVHNYRVWPERSHHENYNKSTWMLVEVEAGRKGSRQREREHGECKSKQLQKTILIDGGCWNHLV